MGPFRHTVDDGLDVRKAAFECMYTLLDTCIQQLDVFEFLTYVENGLKDSYDIKVLAYFLSITFRIFHHNAFQIFFADADIPYACTVGQSLPQRSIEAS